MKQWTCVELDNLEIPWIALNNHMYLDKSLVAMLENKGFFVIPSNDNGYPLMTESVPIQTLLVTEFIEAVNKIKIRKPKKLTKRTRFLVLRRDKYKCQICGASAKNGNAKLEIDHVIPKSKGGTNRLDNLQTLCLNCNRGKSNLSL